MRRWAVRTPGNPWAWHILVRDLENCTLNWAARVYVWRFKSSGMYSYQHLDGSYSHHLLGLFDPYMKALKFRAQCQPHGVISQKTWIFSNAAVRKWKSRFFLLDFSPKQELYKLQIKFKIQVLHYNVTLRRVHITTGVVKKTSITYSEYMFVALVVQLGKRMRHTAICGLPSSTIFFHIIS